MVDDYYWYPILVWFCFNLSIPGFRVLIFDLNHTLEVNIHWIREFKSLEICIAYNWSWGAKVFDFLEFWHYFWSGDTSKFIHKLNWSSFSIMSHAISHQHVKLVLVILRQENFTFVLQNCQFQFNHLVRTLFYAIFLFTTFTYI